MHPRSFCSAFSLLAVSSSLVACGGSSSDTSNGSSGGAGSGLVPSTGPVAPEDMPHEMAIMLCNLLARCNPNSVLSTPAYAQQCLSETEKEFADQSIPGLNAAIAAGKVMYDGTKIRACLDVYPQLACDYSNVSVLDAACGNIWGGTVAVGGVCNSSFECASSSITSTCKSSTSACPGVCTARSGVGEACPGTDDCLENLACDTTDHICKVPLKSGDACGSSSPSGGVCGGILRCVQMPSGQYQCGNLFGTSSGQQGDTCNSMLSCVAGLVCTTTSELADGGTNHVARCETPSNSGGACQFAASNPCPDSQFCPIALADIGTTTSQCAPQIDPDQACTGKYLYECKGDARCYNGKCLARQRLGGTCVGAEDCYSNNCVNAVCVAEELCGH